jgi:hypothetical protein
MIPVISRLLSNTKLIGMVVVVTIIVTCTLYFVKLVDDNARLKVEKESLERHHQSLILLIEDHKKRYLESEQRRSDYANKVAEIEREASTYRDCVASGKCGVRIKTSCPTLPKLPSDSVRVDSGTSELDSVTGLNLLNLREGIKKLESKYSLCQSELKARSDTQ